MRRKEKVITDKHMKDVFEGTNFGGEEKTHIGREHLIKYSLLKIASGYKTGHTMKCIMEELGLIFKYWNEITLTGKGQYHLWQFFSEEYKKPR